MENIIPVPGDAEAGGYLKSLALLYYYLYYLLTTYTSTKVLRNH